MARRVLGAAAFLAVVVGLAFASLRFGLGRLPGDIVVDRGGFVLYVPITTSIILSLLLGLGLWLARR
jgi:hypothetical protein